MSYQYLKDDGIIDEVAIEAVARGDNFWYHRDVRLTKPEVREVVRVLAEQGVSDRWIANYLDMGAKAPWVQKVRSGYKRPERTPEQKAARREADRAKYARHPRVIQDPEEVRMRKVMYNRARRAKLKLAAGL